MWRLWRVSRRTSTPTRDICVSIPLNPNSSSASRFVSGISSANPRQSTPFHRSCPAWRGLFCTIWSCLILLVPLGASFRHGPHPIFTRETRSTHHNITLRLSLCIGHLHLAPLCAQYCYTWSILDNPHAMAEATPAQPASAGTSKSSSASPGTPSLAWLVHSQDSISRSLPPEIDDKPLVRQKRRRTRCVFADRQPWARREGNPSRLGCVA